MGRRTGEKPNLSHTFLQRICHALDVTPRELAKAIGEPYREVEPLLDARHALAEIDRDATWWKISEYVDEHIALCLAAKAELSRALQKDRAKRALRIAQSRARLPKASPRS